MRVDPVEIRLLGPQPSEMAELQRVIEEAPTYAYRVAGAPPAPTEAQGTYSALPPGKSTADKFVLGVYRAGVMVGVIDLIRGYPVPDMAWLGLLLVSEKHQRQGIGRQAFRLAADVVRGWGTCRRVRMAVVGTNSDVIPFWRSLGFEPTEEIRPYRSGSVVSEVILFEMQL